MIFDRFFALPILIAAMLIGAAPAAAQTVRTPDDVIRQLNRSPVVEGRSAIKSYEILFDAYLRLTPPPMEIGPDFNVATIHPGMRNWDRVAGWAESNAHMADAIIEAKDRSILGLPYGRSGVKSEYIEAGLIADIAPEGDLRNATFPHLDAADVMAAFATAEMYRLLEAGQMQRALDLAVAHIFVVRQYCDREMLEEKSRSIQLLIQALSNLRDVFYTYRERITADQFRRIAINEIPFLRPDRNALFMPEGDRIVAEALLREVLDDVRGADPEKFARTFAAVQSRHEPLTRFGAARRWEQIAHHHGFLTASLERLTLIYDDWWRRWRVQEYDPILGVQSQFERTNPIRYAAVIYSLQDLQSLFNMRRELIVAVNGTALVAGLCAYERFYGSYPALTRMAYAQFVRKSSDIDPYSREYGPMLYLVPTSRHSIDTAAGRAWVEPGTGILYSRGQNLADDRALRHTDDGVTGDIVVWPPIKALQREQGLIQ